MKKSKTNPLSIQATKRVNLGKLPVFLQMGHRSLEKSQPPGVPYLGDTSFVLSKDILGMSITDPTLLEDIECVTMIYGGKK